MIIHFYCLRNCNLLLFFSYNCWVYNPIAAVSLAILAREYYLASRLVNYLGNLTPTIELLTQINKLIKLIESPLFIKMRLELLDENNLQIKPLFKLLYSLLMILPQVDQFRLLIGSKL